MDQKKKYHRLCCNFPPDRPTRWKFLYQFGQKVLDTLDLQHELTQSQFDDLKRRKRRTQNGLLRNKSPYLLICEAFHTLSIKEVTDLGVTLDRD